MPRTLIAAVALGLAFLTSGAPAETRVKLETSHGDIVIDLADQAAPKTVANFLAYVKDGFYAGTIFHRVIDGFMLQGGGFDESFARRDTRAPVENESPNGLRNDRGTVAMARTSDPHSGTSQFFINVVDNDFLNRDRSRDGWGYCVFGRVVEGMEVVDRIRKMPTTANGPHRNVPTEPVVIKSASVLP
jgi:cyclophilin family peptidyl-prolyl cis-trans isomerase